MTISQSDSSPTKQSKPEAGSDNGKSQKEISDDEVVNDKNTTSPQYDPTESGCDAARFSYDPPTINYPISPVYNPFGSVSSSGDSPSTHVYSPFGSVSSSGDSPSTHVYSLFGSGCGTRSPSSIYSPSYSPTTHVYKPFGSGYNTPSFSNSPPSDYSPTTPVYNPCHTLRSSPYSSSPTKQKPGLGNGNSQYENGDESKEVNTSGTREEKDYEVENGSPYHCTSPRYCPWSPTSSPPEDYSYGPKDMEAEKNKTCDTLKEIGDESSHVDSRNDQEAEAIRVIHVPSPKVDLLVGAVATLRFLQHNLCSRIYILKDSEVDLKATQRPVELTGTVAQIEFAQKLIDSILAEENYEEPMEVEAEKQKDCNALIEKVAESGVAATSPRT